MHVAAPKEEGEGARRALEPPLALRSVEGREPRDALNTHGLHTASDLGPIPALGLPAAASPRRGYWYERSEPAFRQVQRESAVRALVRQQAAHVLAEVAPSSGAASVRYLPCECASCP